MGYYDAQKGYYVGDSGQSDYDRTVAAIQYYQKNNMADKAKSALEYAQGRGYTNPYSTASKSTAKSNTPSVPKTNSQAGPFANANASGKYYVPYESAITDLISQYPAYTPKTDSEMQSEAQNYADIQVNPQKTSLQTALTNAINSLNSQESEVNAAYSNVGTTADRLLRQAQEQGTVSAIARGGGRSGAVEHEVGKLKEPIMENVTQAEAEKAAKLSGIANSRTAAQTNYDNAVTDLEAQRGALVAQQLAAIKDLDYAKQTGRADAILNATQKLAEITQKANEFNNTLLYNYSSLMGQMPDTGSSTALNALNNTTVSGNLNSSPGNEVGLRAYAESRGASVGWDPTTQEVTVNGKKYSPYQLRQMGATIKNNSWYIPESAVRAMM